MVMHMINFTLFKKEFKSNLVLYGIFSLVILMYGIIVVDLFNPLEDSSWIEQIMQIMPELMSFFGFALEDVTNYQAFVAGYLYDMLFILLGIIFITMLVNRLVFRYLDQGSFGYLIATPNSRTKIMFTQAVTLICYLLMQVMLMFVIVAGYGKITHRNYVDIGRIFYLNFSFFLLLLFISSITFCFLSLLEGKLATGLNIGVLTFFFFAKLISNLGGNYEFFKFLTPFSLFNPRMIVSFSKTVHIYNVILGLVTILIYTLTFKLFNKRDLAI